MPKLTCSFCSLSSFLIALFLAAQQVAWSHEDFLISHNGSKLITGGYDDSIPGVTDEGPKRVYEFDVEFINPGQPYSSPDPGIQSRHQAELSTFQALPVGEDLSFRMLPITIGASSRNLWYWDGVGPVNFTTLGSNSMLKLEHPSSLASTSINGATDATVPGFLIQTVSSGPDPVHRHLETTLSTAGGEPEQGIYLASVDFELTGGLGRSDQAFLVYATVDELGSITEEMHEAAVEWVTANLLAESPGPGNSAVPEPNSALLLGSGTLLFTLVRRKRTGGVCKYH